MHTRPHEQHTRCARDEANAQHLPARVAERRRSALPGRHTGRPDLPVIAPQDSPARVARRLV
jgi:hypothetical protein